MMKHVGAHKFADDVSEIVDQSAKEAKIEKKLTLIRNTWSKMTVDFDRTREDCPLLTGLDLVIETLEAHSLEMMGMTSQGRFIEFCLASVTEWSQKLRTVDAVFAVWQKVQRNWCRRPSPLCKDPFVNFIAGHQAVSLKYSARHLLKCHCDARAAT